MFGTSRWPFCGQVELIVLNITGFMKKNIRTRIITKLRDPIWQAIGALIALIALVTSFFIGNLVFRGQQSGRNRLMISSQTSQELTDVPTPVNKRMQVLIDGKEEKGLRLFIFRLEYKGQEPMRPNDFEIPLRGHIPDGRKLLGVQRSGTLEGP